MRNFIANALTGLANRIRGKAAPPAVHGNQWSGTSYVDAYKRNREPTPNEMLAELKGTAWTCITLNAAACARYMPTLYVCTNKNQPTPKCFTKSLTKKQEEKLRDSTWLPARCRKAQHIDMVL